LSCSVWRDLIRLVIRNNLCEAGAIHRNPVIGPVSGPELLGADKEDVNVVADEEEATSNELEKSHSRVPKVEAVHPKDPKEDREPKGSRHGVVASASEKELESRMIKNAP